MRLELFQDNDINYPVTSLEMDYILGFDHTSMEGDCIPYFIVSICEEFLYYG